VPLPSYRGQDVRALRRIAKRRSPRRRCGSLACSPWYSSQPCRWWAWSFWPATSAARRLSWLIACAVGALPGLFAHLARNHGKRMSHAVAWWRMTGRLLSEHWLDVGCVGQSLGILSSGSVPALHGDCRQNVAPPSPASAIAAMQLDHSPAIASAPLPAQGDTKAVGTLGAEPTSQESRAETTVGLAPHHFRRFPQL